MIDAAIGASAHRVIAVTPWFGYSRQDKKSAPREPISARLVARMIEAAGADRVLTMDLHAGQVQGFFRKPVDHMTALMMLTQYFNDLGLQDLVVVAPDAGRVKLNKKFASKIGAELAILDKERPAQQVAEIGYVIGDVRGRTAIIVDDMIDTAGTLRAAGQTVLDEGAAPHLRGRHPPRPQRRRLREPRRQPVRADRRHRHDPAAPRRAGQHPRPELRRAAHRLDPPDLHRRLGVRGLRRREPALLSGRREAPRRPAAAPADGRPSGGASVVDADPAVLRQGQVLAVGGDAELHPRLALVELALAPRLDLVELELVGVPPAVTRDRVAVALQPRRRELGSTPPAPGPGPSCPRRSAWPRSTACRPRCSGSGRAARPACRAGSPRSCP